MRSFLASLPYLSRICRGLGGRVRPWPAGRARAAAAAAAGGRGRSPVSWPGPGRPRRIERSQHGQHPAGRTMHRPPQPNGLVTARSGPIQLSNGQFKMQSLIWSRRYRHSGPAQTSGYSEYRRLGNVRNPAGHFPCDEFGSSARLGSTAWFCVI